MNSFFPQSGWMVEHRLTRKEWLRLAPLLIFYAIVIFIFGEYSYDDISGLGDQGRYLYYAQNLLEGSYTEPENPYLNNGPGYPAFLVPFVGLNISPIVPTLFNGLFVFLAAVFLYKTLLFYLPAKGALISAYCLGLYYPLFRHLILLQTESLALFLIVAFLYFTIKVLRSERGFGIDILRTGLALGALILTKFVFGDVLWVCLMAASLAFFFVPRKKALKCLGILAIGFLAAIPWLFYTYSLTGRFPFWGTEGGEQLYWMSVRHEGEYGNWNYFPDIEAGLYPEFDPQHLALYQSLKDKPFVEQNDEFVKAAVNHIKNDPKAYLANVPANFSRLWFGLPESHKDTGFRHVYYIFINMFPLVLLAISLIPAWKFRKKIDFEILAMAFFILVYVSGIVLVQARPRHLIVVIPFIIMWLTYIYSRFLDVKFKLPAMLG